MKALFAFDGKYEYCDGKYYSNGLPASTWSERYLNIFDSIVVIGRIVRGEDIDRKTLSSCEGVIFHCTEIGVNPIELFTKRQALEQFIENEVKQVDFVIARLALSLFGAIAVKYAQKYRIPYVCEVVANVWDSIWNYSFAGKIVAPYFEYLAKKTVWQSDYTIYVTQSYLQEEYPTKGKAIGISNVDLKEVNDGVLKQRLKKIEQTDCKHLLFCTIAAVDVKFKGQEYMIKAIKELKKHGYTIKYILIGGGNQNRLKKIARSCDVEKDVIFTGAIEHSQIFELLDKADVYIQPSLQEGLPRAMIEALSRGLPAIGFRTAGIPELISDKYVCKRKSVRDICKCIMELDIAAMKQAAIQNHEKSKEFLFETLNKRREMFIREAIGK